MFIWYTSLVSHAYQLCPQENVLSIASCTLALPGGEEERNVFLVGTALVRPEEKEASVGRLMVFHVNNGNYILFVIKILYLYTCIQLTN